MAIIPNLRKPAPKVLDSSDPFVAEFKTYLRIDRNDLDTVVSQHAELYFRVAEEAARAVSVRDESEERSKEADAEIDRWLRDHAKEKETEVSIKSRIQTDDKHIAAREKYSAARKRAAVLTALERAFDQRGKMLRELVNLHGQGYFAVAGRARMQAAREQRGSTA